MNEDNNSPENDAAPVDARLLSRRRFLSRVAKLGVVGALPAGYGYWVEPDQVRVAETEVRLADWPKAASGLRIGHLSDPHCDSEHEVVRAERAAKLLLAQKPDVVFLTGDYTTRFPHPWSGRAARALAPLTQTRHGVFAVLGNHDWTGRDPQGITRNLRDAGITVLRNSPAPLANIRGVWVVGLDPRSECKHNPERGLRDIPERAVKLLLIHEPDYADEAPPVFSLQFSGHSHGGQIRIPGLPPLHTPSFARKYIEGLHQTERHPVYVTRGVGMVRPKMRICCPPEVGVITVRQG